MVRCMLVRNSSVDTLAPCANSAVESRYGGRKTKLAISQAIANSALSTEARVSPATTGTICEADASDRLSAWLRRASPLIPRTWVWNGGRVRSPRGSRSRHHAKGTETTRGRTQHSWITWASVKPRASRPAVTGNRRLDATRLRATWTPDRLSARQASSMTSAQQAPAMPTTNVTAPTGVAERVVEAAGQQRMRSHQHGTRHEGGERHHQQRPEDEGPLAGGPVQRQLGDEHGAEAEHGDDAEQRLGADRRCRDADLARVDEPRDQDPEDQPEQRCERLGEEQGAERRPDAVVDPGSAAQRLGAALQSALMRCHRCREGAAPGGRAGRATPTTPRGRS